MNPDVARIRTVPGDVRLRLAQSAAQLEGRRELIVSKTHERLLALETPDEDFGQAEVTALLLVNLLIDCGRDLAFKDSLRDLQPVGQQHRRFDIDGRHYSRFGSILAPVLRESCGVRLSPESASAWCDAFWYIIGKIPPATADRDP